MIRKIVNEDYPEIIKYYGEFVDADVDMFDVDPFNKIFVYEEDRKVVAFINFSIIYDRAELNYIYVDEAYRKRGIADELMEFFITEAIDNGCNNITLEVDKNNEKGLELYKKYGFEPKAIRKNYYKDGDGILMMRELMKNEK
jgi:ribosomal-protein-alanine N-acetyltransferase